MRQMKNMGGTDQHYWSMLPGMGGGQMKGGIPDAVDEKIHGLVMEAIILSMTPKESAPIRAFLNPSRKQRIAAGRGSGHQRGKPYCQAV